MLATAEPRCGEDVSSRLIPKPTLRARPTHISKVCRMDVNNTVTKPEHLNAAHLVPFAGKSEKLLQQINLKFQGQNSDET